MDASEGDSNVENFEHQVTIKEELDERVKDFTFGSLNDVLAYENPLSIKTENNKVMPENVSKFLCNVPNIKVKEEITDEELQAGLCTANSIAIPADHFATENFDRNVT